VIEDVACRGAQHVRDRPSPSGFPSAYSRGDLAAA
jgi:hypothetical protein